MCQAFSIINFSLFFLYKIRLSLWKGILNRDGQQFQQNNYYALFEHVEISYIWIKLLYIKHSPILLLQVFIPVDSLPQQFILWIIMCIALHL
jgi:hypothetical protein